MPIGSFHYHTNRSCFDAPLDAARCPAYYRRSEGGILTYADLHAFAWWYGGGWVTLNRGRKGLRRIHRGAEDVSRVRR